MTSGTPLIFEDWVRWRRDVRRIKTDPVDAAALDKIFALADLAPTTGNSLPWRIIEVQSASARYCPRKFRSRQHRRRQEPQFGSYDLRTRPC